MTAYSSIGRARLRSPGDLVAALGIAFSDEQLAAITAPLEPAVIIAGAGSGKTTVMAARVVWLVGSGAVRPGEVLGLTFTRKAAAELGQRIRAALVRAQVLSSEGVDDEGEQVVLTYDSFAARLVSEHGLWLGFEGDPRMITGASRFRIASRVVSSAAGPFDHISRLRPASVTDRVLSLDAQLQAHLVDEAELHHQARTYLLELANAPLNNRRQVYASVRAAEAAARERLELASLVRSYQELKRELGYVEFADQMAAAARLAQEVPGVSAALRRQFPVVLLDEYQDTSSAQAVLLRGLFSGPTPSTGRGHAVTAVGDPFQAIYGWRGAAASNILQFPQDFPRVDGTEAAHLSLTVNRRSGPRILDVANVLATPLRQDPTLAYDLSGAVLRAPDDTPPGHVMAGMFSSWPEEVAWIADRIVESGPSARTGTWSEIACLLRRNGDIGPLYAALTARDVPVEIVGLGGLLSVPEVADVVATLRVLDDVTENPSLVRILTGPRWRIGHVDLELLGRRARELARSRPATDDVSGDALTAALEAAVAEVDPSELVSLVEALDDPGEWPYSDSARQRFGLAATELSALRRHCGDPVLDLVRRVVTTLGLDVEVSAETSAVEPLAQLGAFVDAVGAYVDVDADASLSGLLAYLAAEEAHGVGLDQVVPSASDSVKLLTVHKAKGLEWDVVYLPALVSDVFPTTRVTDNWVRSASSLPSELRGDRETVPQLTEASDAGFTLYDQALKEDLRRAEDRLAYVAVTRARQLLVGTGHQWRVGEVKPRQASPYLGALLAAAEQAGTVVASVDPPGAMNPLDGETAAYEWPQPPDPEALVRRRAAAAAVERFRTSSATAVAEHQRLTEALAMAPTEVAAQVAAWDDALDRLVAEAQTHHQRVVEVPLPSSLSATDVLRAHRDPASYAARLARPMPGAPSRSARFGTRFHEWVVRHFDAPTLIDPDEVLDRTDDDPADEDLDALCRSFAAGCFGDVVPAALELPFLLLIAGQLVRGRIDAVYTAGAVVPDGFAALVVDWKTGRTRSDPLQLALYRLAWADLQGVPPEAVAAAFYHVRDDRVELVTDLPDRQGVELLLRGLGR